MGQRYQTSCVATGQGARPKSDFFSLFLFLLQGPPPYFPVGQVSILFEEAPIAPIGAVIKRAGKRSEPASLFPPSFLWDLVRTPQKKSARLDRNKENPIPPKKLELPDRASMNKFFFSPYNSDRKEKEEGKRKGQILKPLNLFLLSRGHPSSCFDFSFFLKKCK